jgi:putative nucleotidyltransferase with HDIG domain
MNPAGQSASQGIDSLPVLSPVVARIAQIVDNPSSSADDVTAALKLDPVVSGKVLKLANSAFVGIPQTISSVKNAVVLLGQNRIRALVMALATHTVCGDGGSLPFSLYRFWRHSITTAMIAESIARHLKRYAAVDPEDAFSAGMLHDIGRLAAGALHAESFVAQITESARLGCPLYEVEKSGTSHTAMGGLLCRRWNFPEVLSCVATYHHAPADAPQENKLLVSITHLSDIMAHIVGYPTVEREAIPEPVQAAIDAVHLPAERLRVIADDTLQNEKKTESLIKFFV